MKKFVLFFVISLLSISAKAQTFDQTQARVDLQSTKLEKELKEVKDRIFYLEVIIPERIMKSKSLTEIQQLKKEAYFSANEVTQLKAKKVLLENAIQKLTKTGLDGIEYRTQADLKSNLPEEMNPREYARRVRANDLKSEIGGEKFMGILANYKTGQGELALITISRSNVKGLAPVISVLLQPGEKQKAVLLAGEYEVTISCGSYSKAWPLSVKPRANKLFEGQWVNWAAFKNQNDF